MSEYIGAIDQGTASTRAMVFDQAGAVVEVRQVEHRQIMPRAGWVEHDPVEIWRNTAGVANDAFQGYDIRALGIANQRETTVVWDRRSGQPFGNAIVWQDTRTDLIAEGLERDRRGELIRERSGLRPATYFAGGKLQWILDNVEGARVAAERGDALFGTMDTWLLWNLTGGRLHATDVTNASRTMLMDLRTLDWDDELLGIFGVPRRMLPEILPSGDAKAYGASVAGVPITAALGDQQAATVGQVCFAPGEAKNTYGTGNFLLLNTGTEPVRSKHGLLTTVAYRFADEPPVYALEGSIAVTGAAVQWLRDQLRIIDSAPAVEALAGRVRDNGGVYFVPAFSGLFAPYWRADARGAIVGLSRYDTDAHIARATLEAICYQTRDVVEAMEQDAGATLRELKVDGGVTANDLCMQLQADILGVPVSRPAVAETTALGAAYAAGLASGFWAGTDELCANWRESHRWTPTWTREQRDEGFRRWHDAVRRTLDWVEIGG